MKLTYEERKYFAENFVQKIGMENRQKTNVVDLKKAAAYIRDKRKKNNESMFIYIQPVKGDLYKEPNHYYSYIKDNTFDVVYGRPAGFLPDGNIRWNKFPIKETEAINLDNISDGEVLAFMLMHPNTLNSPFQIADPIHKIYDPEWEAKEELNKTQRVKIALKIIPQLNPDEIVPFARFCQIDVKDDSSFNIIMAKLENLAINNPEKLINNFEDKTRNLKMAFESAYEMGFIKDTNKGFSFEGFQLGMQKENAISKLKSDTDLYGRLIAMLKERDIYTKRISKEAREIIKEKDKKTISINASDAITFKYPNGKVEDLNAEMLRKKLKDANISFHPSTGIEKLAEKYVLYLESLAKKSIKTFNINVEDKTQNKTE